jgi:PAS domain S-box-containing protein
LENNTTNYRFLHGGGEMGELTRGFNWASTPVGPVEQWPLSLRNTVAMVLSSKFPMFLWWGEELTQFYNDAYRPSLGDNGKHPLALGQKGIDCWPEIWDTIFPLIEKVRRNGESAWFEDLLLPIYRNGRMEDVYWTFSYSAVIGDTGNIDGILVVCTETTDKVNNLQNLKENKNQLEFAIEATELGTWDLNPLTGNFTGNARLKEWFGLKPEDEIPLTAATEVIAPKDREAVIEAIAYALQYESGGSYDIEYTINNPVTKAQRIVRAKGRAWFDDTNTAYRFNGTLQDITKHKKALEEAARAGQLADLAIKSSGVGLFSVDLLTGEIEYSPTFAYVLTGNDAKKEITRKAFVSYIHPDDADARTTAIEEGYKTNEFYYSPRVIWDDGSIHRMVVMGANTFDADGRAIVFSGTVRDITILEEQRLALEKADAMFRNVTNSSPTGLWLSDADGSLTYINKTLADWTGMHYKALLGSGWADAIIEEDRQRATATFIESVASRSHYDVLFRIKKGTGQVVWCHAAGDPYFNPDGSFAGFAGFCMDINEIIEGRRALSQSEDRFKAMIAEAPVATCLFVGRDMVIEVANDIMLGYWGKDNSIIGKALIKALPELKGQPFLEILDNVFTTGETYEVKNAAAKLEKGSLGTYYFDFTYKPLFDATGNVYAIMGIAIDVTEQVLSQRRIEESQKQILDSFEKSPVGIAIISREQLTFTMANPFYGELVGRHPDQIIGKPLLEALPELKGQGFDQLLINVIETGVPYIANEVSAQLMRNGILETIYVDLAYQPKPDQDNTITGVLVVATDVTQQVLSRQKVEASEAKFRSLIEKAPVATCLFVGRELKLEVVNEIMLEYWGADSSVIGMPLAEAVPEIKGQRFLSILDNVYNTGKTYEVKASPAQLRTGGIAGTYYFDFTYKPLFNNDGEVYAIINMALDVTEQVLARQKIENAQAALHGAIELAELATWRLNIKDNTFSYSPRFMDWLGFTDDTKSIDEAYNPLPEEFVAQVDAAIKAAISKESDGIYENEHPIINRVTGQVRIIHAQAQVAYDAEGNPDVLSGTAQDVTKERRLQQQLEFEVQQRTEELQEANTGLAEAINALEQNNQELRQFAYIASHDLQEPARKISIFAKMLTDSLTSIDERSRTYLNKINNSAERMGNLIHDVLGYSQLSKGNDLFETVDLDKIAGETITDFELTIEQTGAVIECKGLPVIEAIPLQMSQLFGNLISNSLKYSRPGVVPVITITASPLSKTEAAAYTHTDTASDYYKIVFTDNGIGFGQEYADKIFNIFQRLHGKTEYSGTGIGLAICKKIIQNHYGHIEAASAENEGATFIVLLPVKQSRTS